MDFDLWAGNVFLEEEGNGYRISGVMDLERCFFGDADADLTSAVGIFDDVEEEPDFLRGYGENVPDPAAETRMELYRLYMSLIFYVEAYRYDEGYRRSVRRYAGKRLRQQLDRLRGM